MMDDKTKAILHEMQRIEYVQETYETLLGTRKEEDFPSREAYLEEIVLHAAEVIQQQKDRFEILYRLHSQR